jgi:cytochrome c
MPSSRTSWALVLAVLALLCGAIALLANQRSLRDQQRQRAEVLTGGHAAHGQVLFSAKGCGGCHTLSGVAQASGMVGPPLDGIAQRAIIAGKLVNKPDNLARWIRAPQRIDPGNAMPNLPMSEQDARDIAAFLYSKG